MEFQGKIKLLEEIIQIERNIRLTEYTNGNIHLTGVSTAEGVRLIKEAKAKGLRSIADKMVTLAKRGDLHARRQAFSVIREKDVVHTLFNEVSDKFSSRQGGYTRIIKLGPRKGDVASMVQIELIFD